MRTIWIVTSIERNQKEPEHWVIGAYNTLKKSIKVIMELIEEEYYDTGEDSEYKDVSQMIKEQERYRLRNKYWYELSKLSESSDGWNFTRLS